MVEKRNNEPSKISAKWFFVGEGDFVFKENVYESLLETWKHRYRQGNFALWWFFCGLIAQFDFSLKIFTFLFLYSRDFLTLKNSCSLSRFFSFTFSYLFLKLLIRFCLLSDLPSQWSVLSKTRSTGIAQVFGGLLNVSATNKQYFFAYRKW